MPVSASFGFELSQLLAHSLDPTRSTLPSHLRLARAHFVSHTLHSGDFSNNDTQQEPEGRMNIRGHNAMIRNLYSTAAF